MNDVVQNEPGSEIILKRGVGMLPSMKTRL